MAERQQFQLEEERVIHTHRRKREFLKLSLITFTALLLIVLQAYTFYLHHTINRSNRPYQLPCIPTNTDIVTATNWLYYFPPLIQCNTNNTLNDSPISQDSDLEYDQANDTSPFNLTYSDDEDLTF